MLNGLKCNGLRIAAVVTLAAVAGGCVSQQSHDGIADTNKTLQSRNTELARQLDQEQQLTKRQADQLVRNEQAIGSLEGSNASLLTQLESERGLMQGFESRLQGIAFGPLDAETDRALAELQRKYPDIIKYDAQRGMLRFSSDLTFTSGSANVKPEAGKSLEQLAGVLKTGAGKSYELLVVGHTDAQRVSNPATVAKHPTNMHLSAHRAIAVRNTLRGAGLPSNGIMIAGWGEHRPIVANSSTGNTPLNRRVEIFLTRPTGVAISTSETATGEIDRAEPPTQQYETTK